MTCRSLSQMTWSRSPMIRATPWFPDARVRLHYTLSSGGRLRGAATGDFGRSREEDRWRSGVIGLGNIGGAIATNLVADGNDVVVYDVDAAAMAAIDGRHGRRRRGVGGPGGRRHPAVAAHARRRGRRWPPPGRPRRRRVPSWSTCRRTARPSCASWGRRWPASGHHLVEAPLTGGAIGAEKRMLVFMVGGDDEPVGRVLPVLEPLGRATFHVGPARARQHHEAAQQPHRLHHDLGQPRGAGHGDQGGHRGAEGGRDPAHRGGVELLHRPPGRDHRRARPADAVRAGAGGEGRRPHRETGAARWARRRRSAAAIKGVLDGAVASGLGGADWSELVAFAERQADVALRWNPR